MMAHDQQSAARSRRKRSKRIVVTGLYLFIGLNLLWTLFPVYWTLLTSLKTIQQMNTMPPLFIFTPTFDNYLKILTGDALLTFRNSLYISVGSMIIGLLIGFPAAYVLARVNFRAKGQANFYILSMRIAPAFAFLVPYYLTFRFLNLLDSYLAMIIIYTTITLPFSIWMMESVFSEIPLEVEEAALVDGCSPTQVMLRIVAPLAVPSIAATAILSFVFCWNEFFFALILTGEHTRTVPVMVTSLIGLMGVDWVKMSAAGILAIIPTIILALFAQRYLVRGLTMGAIKA
jgi:multiple sugar transport system permease protein